jgi:sugar lactone lactonase YvrE
MFLALAWMFLAASNSQAATFALGASTLVVGPSPGSNSVVLAVDPQNGTWTAITNATWLHLNPANQNGTGSATVVFSYDGNSGDTRSGTLDLAGLTFTVTQAGSNYVPAGPVPLLPSPAAKPVGQEGPFGAAVNDAGDVFTLDFYSVLNYAEIDEWVMTQNTEMELDISGIAEFNLRVNGAGNVLATDAAGNFYVADIGSNAIVEWEAGTGNLNTLVSSGLNLPCGLALDGAGDLYIADSANNAIKKWTAATSNVTTLVSTGLNNPIGVAVDGAGNVYIVDNGNAAIKEWRAASINVTTLVSSGLTNPVGVGVDGSGNVYIADDGNSVKEWMPASSNMITLMSSDTSGPGGVAVDGSGNLYIAGFSGNWLEERPQAFVDPSPRTEKPLAGNDVLPRVLPATQNLLPPFAPASDQYWLTVTGVTNGVVSFSFTAASTNRTGHIALLGQSIPITQSVVGTPPVLSSARMLSNGAFQFEFTNDPGTAFTVLATTNLSLPVSNWTVAGTATNIAPGLFQFTSQPTTDDARLFYTVRSP